MIVADIYARLSDDPEGTAEAVARQEAAARAYADREGWTVGKVHVDNDLSAFDRRVKRPGYDAALERLRSGAAGRLIVWKLDRLTRKPREGEDVLDLIEATPGSGLASLHDPVDLTSPMGRMAVRMAFTMAAAESETTSLRTRAAKADRAARGEPNGGARPFGWTFPPRAPGEPNRLILEPAEARIGRALVDRVLEGESVNAVTVDLTEREPAFRGSRSGQPMTPRNVRNWLRSPRLYGALVHRGEVVFPANVEPLISRERWEDLQAVLRGVPAGPRPGPRRALSGLMRCGRCGAPLHANAHVRPSKSQYRCHATPGNRAGDGGRACGRLAVKADAVEDVVGAALAAALDSPEAADALAGARDDTRERDALREVDALRARVALLQDERYLGEGPAMSDARYHRLARELGSRIAAAEDRLAAARSARLRVALGAGETIAQGWATRGPDWARSLAAAMLEVIVIDPPPPGFASRRGFDPSRVRLVWRAAADHQNRDAV